MTDFANECRRQAEEYLREQLGTQAPRELGFAAEFDERPLEEEGRVCVFTFDLGVITREAAASAQATLRRVAAPHYVVAGATSPNYFPQYGLAADDAYSLHLGTRFMLELGVARADPAEEPPQARDELRTLVGAAASGARIEREELAALFRCGEKLFAVYRLSLEGEGDVYCLGADCPPGFYRLTEHPPQVALRLHLGKLIRTEARDAAAGFRVREKST